MIRSLIYAFVSSRRAMILVMAATLLAILFARPLATAWLGRLAERAAIQRAQELEIIAQLECECHLASIQAGIVWYQRRLGGLPPAHLLDDSETPVHSWRALISLTSPPGRNDFQDRYSLATPWNSPENLPLLYHEEGDYMTCPANSEAVRSRYTTYVVVVGENTLWPGAEGRTNEELEGNEDRILFIEIPRTDIAWLEPRDITFKEALEMYTEWDGFRSANHPNGLHYVTLYGHIHRFSEILDRDDFAELLQIRPLDDAQ